MRSALHAVRARTDELFSLLKPEALYERPIPERHRVVFYLGHLEAFDWNLIGKWQFRLPSFNQEFDQLFAFGIDPINGNLPQDHAKDWPAVSEIHEYNAALRQQVDRCLENDADRTLVHVAMEHRLMHAETFAYLMHALPLSMKHAQAQPELEANSNPIEDRNVEISAGTATLGKDANGKLHEFGWDNEFGRHEVNVPSFTIQKYKVTNAQYLEFVNSGGYDKASLWSPAAWTWIKAQSILHPHFWNLREGKWRCRTMFGESPFQPNWPCYVSHAEAEAYTRWSGTRLPTEAQFHRAAFGMPGSSNEREYPWGKGSDARPQSHHGNFDGQRWDPVPVDAHPQGDSAFGVSDLVGNGWEWTCTPFAPFPGFKAFEFYPGYSADFFDGKHYVLKGGSPRTAAVLLRRSFRNWFQPLYPHIYAGFRCVEN
jgi:iron(II)-dependent oxidoreductase